MSAMFCSFTLFDVLGGITWYGSHLSLSQLSHAHLPHATASGVHVFVASTTEQGVDISVLELKSSMLAQVEQLLQTNGQTLKEFADMSFPDPLDSIEPYDTVFFDELNFNRTDLATISSDLVSHLNRPQRVAYDTISNAVSSTMGGFFFCL
ncbi:hypothetical protein Ahy_B01g056887 isoform A [Arachis hypogaea]|uniref:Uncharacterized protein n=1 Tax=Arachis hypogaea TaxID=3818 RepID=A0A445AZS4_ARAHY|nr:hypothetical protein Ahy_B01g056887 isoform A [Arachis hypogaea]